MLIEGIDRFEFLQLLFLVIHVSGGLVRDVRGFSEKEPADKCEEKLCKDNGIPYDADKREKYYEKNLVDDEILRWEVYVE